MPTTNYPNGLQVVARGTPFGQIGYPHPGAYEIYHNEFHLYDASDWTITTVELGAGSATESIATGLDHTLTITNAAGDNDSDFLHFANRQFTLEAGKKCSFECRVQVTDATQTDWLIGLQIADTTPLDAADGIWFQSDDGDANIDCYVAKDSVQSVATAVATAADNVFMALGWYYDGANEITFYKDGQKVASLDATNIPDDQHIRVSFGIQNGEAAAKSMHIDSITVIKER